MINIFEIELLRGLQTFWNNLLTNLDTPNDYVPDIFAILPPTGDGSSNQQAISALFKDLGDGADHDRLKISLQYPITRAHVPCVVIEVGAEQEDPVVGREVYQVQNPATGKWEVYSGGPFVKTYSLGMYSFNPDTTLYLFSMVKFAILLLTGSFVATGSAVLSARPMQIDFQRFAPDPVYIRYLDIRCEGSIDTAVERFDSVQDVEVADPSNTTYVAVNSKVASNQNIRQQ